MKYWIGTALATAMRMQIVCAQPAALKVVYPPPNHETTSEQIFLIGTAPADAVVTLNGKPIANRSPAGHFSPSIPLQMGSNTIAIQAQNQTLTLVVKRISDKPPDPTGFAFAAKSLTPAVDIARMPNEPICFSSIALLTHHHLPTSIAQTVDILWLLFALPAPFLMPPPKLALANAVATH